MPLDTSIPMQQVQVQAPNMMGMYANALAMQNSQQQNRLGEVQYQNAMRAQQDDEAARQVYAEVGGDRTKAVNAMMSRGLFKQGLALEDANLKRREQLAKIDKEEVATSLQKLGTLSSLMAPLVEKGDGVTQAEILEVGKRAHVLGVLPEGWAASIPLNATQVPAFVRQVAASTANGREALKALQQEIKYLNIGGEEIPVNTNTLAAGGVGPVKGLPSIKRTMSPAEVAANERAKATAGKTYDSERGVVIDTNAATATPVTQAGKPLPAKQPEFAKKEEASIAAQDSTITKALEYVRNQPQAFGMMRGMATASGNLPEAAAQKMSGKEANEARAFVYNIVSKVINERAGAAQSAQELARLRGFLPSEYDDAEVIGAKLRGFRTYLNEQKKAYAPGAKNSEPAGDIFSKADAIIAGMKK